MNNHEPILVENKDRFVMFPIKHEELWSLYKKLECRFWYVDSISFDDDIKDYKEKLTQAEKDLIYVIISAFQIRHNNDTHFLVSKFLHEVQYPEARCFYGNQLMLTNIHYETYSLLSGTYLGDVSKHDIFNEITKAEAFKKKSDWKRKVFDDEPDFSKRMISMILIQQVLSSFLFASVAEFRKREVMKVFCMLITFIYEDECLFTDFSLTIYNQLKNKPSHQHIKSVIESCNETQNSLFSLVNKYFSQAGMDIEKIKSLNNYHSNRIYKILTNENDRIDIVSPYELLKWDNNFIKDKKAQSDKSKDREILFDVEF